MASNKRKGSRQVYLKSLVVTLMVMDAMGVGSDMIGPTFCKAYPKCKWKIILNRSKSGVEHNFEQNTEVTLPSHSL